MFCCTFYSNHGILLLRTCDRMQLQRAFLFTGEVLLMATTRDLRSPSSHGGLQKYASPTRCYWGNPAHLVFSLPGFVALAEVEHSSSFDCSLHNHGGNLGICCEDSWSLLHKVASTEKITCHLETGCALSEVCLACPSLQKINKHTHKPHHSYYEAHDMHSSPHVYCKHIH